MSIKRIFIVISAIFAASAVFADNSSVTSKKYVDDLMSGYQGKLPGSGANTLMIYDDETGIGEKSIAATLGNSASATSVPTVGAVKTGLDGKQDTITGTAGYVMTGTGNAGEVGERAIYSANTNYTDALVTAETVNTAVTNAVNSSLIRVDANGNPSDNGTLWEINTSLFALTLLPAGYTQLEWIESTGTQYIDTEYKPTSTSILDLTIINFQTMQTSGHLVFGCGEGEWSTSKGWVSGIAGSTGSITWNSQLSSLKVTYNTLGITTGNVYTLRYGPDAAFVNGVKKVDFNGSPAIPQSYDKSFWLFKTNNTTSSYNNGSWVFGRTTLYDNGVLVRNFIPAKNSNNVIGMYDTVSGQFFTNQGTGEFIAGPPVGN